MKEKYIGFLLLFLFFLAPFIQSDTSDETQPDFLLSIPPIISIISSYLRWLIIGICVFVFFNKIKSLNVYFTKYHLFFSLFYLFPLLYSIVTNTDVPRYLSLFVIATTLPVVMTSQFDKHKQYFTLKNFRLIISVCLALSLLVSLPTVLNGLRFQGILGNSNMYGITAAFWLAILLIEKEHSRFTIILAVLTIITIILSGSRGALIAAIAVITLGLGQQLKNFIRVGLLIIAFLLVLSFTIDLSFIYSRIESISDSAKDSGRKDIWDNAFMYINQNPWGYGMNAPLELLNTGNVHNAYVRYLLTMGYGFALVTISMYLILSITSVFDKKLPRSLVGFIIGYAIANLGEDFFIGAGSSIFIYINMLIALLSFYNLKTLKN